MLSLKPPWRQKNPIMEKACPAYYKNTAPEKAREILKNLKAKDLDMDRVLKEKEVVFNGETGGVRRTVALFIRKNRGVSDPQLLVSITTTKEKEKAKNIVGAKISAHAHALYYKGEQILRFSSGQSGGFKWYNF